MQHAPQLNQVLLYIKLNHVGKVLFIKTYCTVDCNSAKSEYWSSRLIAPWIADFGGGHDGLQP